MLKAATELVSSLSEDQKKLAVMDFTSGERHNWHFIPRARKGIPLKDLDEPKRKLVQALLDAGLSEIGARRAREVMQLEGILREIEGTGGAFVRDPLLYHVTVFGVPATDGEWGWRFEGHHLSLNFTLRGEKTVAATPCFFGANPALVRDGPRKGLRVLAGLEDVARKLVDSLDAKQLEDCLDEEVPQEVPETEKPRYTGPFPEGLSSATLSASQREILASLVLEYTLSLAPDLAAVLESRFRAEKPADVHFAWRGGRKPFEPHSYLIHGKTFVVNYSNVQNGGAHVHGAVRQLPADFEVQPAPATETGGQGGLRPAPPESR